MEEARSAFATGEMRFHVDTLRRAAIRAQDLFMQYAVPACIAQGWDSVIPLGAAWERQNENERAGR
jgi:hypothetical protein